MAADTPVSFIPMAAISETGLMAIEETRSLDDVRAGYTFFRNGDVVIAKITPCFENGKGAIARNLVNGIGFGTTELFVVRPSAGVDERFLYYFTTSNYFRHTGTGLMYGAGGQRRIPDSMVLDVPFPAISRQEQKTIADFLDRETAEADALVAKYERLMELLEEKRVAVITRAVTKGLDPDAPLRESGVASIGMIPSSWKVHALRRVIDEFVDYRGSTPTKVLSGIRIVTAANVKMGYIDYNAVEVYMSEAEFETRMVRGLPAIGDVLLTMEAPLGQCAQVDNEQISLGQRVMLLKTKASRISASFLKWFFLSRAGQDELKSLATGSTALGIKASKLKGITLSVPSLDEQLAITGFIENAVKDFGRLSELTANAIMLVRENRSALITAAVTGQIDVHSYSSNEQREVSTL